MLTSIAPYDPAARVRGGFSLGSGIAALAVALAWSAVAGAQGTGVPVRSVADVRVAPASGTPALPGGATAERSAGRGWQIESAGSAPDTVRLAELTRGVRMTVQVVGDDGRPVATPVSWHVVSGDVALTAAAPRTNAEGHATATFGRPTWLRGRAGRVVVEARTPGAVGGEALSRRLTFLLVP